MNEEAIIPDLGKMIKTTIKEVKPPEDAGNDLGWARIGKSPDWTVLLKPYLEDRILSLRAMTDVDLDGKESVQEVGVRFLICTAIAGELQNLIDLVEQTRMVIDEKEQEEKKVVEEKSKKELVKKKR